MTEAEWEAEVEKHAGPVLVYFWATWCGPCKLMATIATWAAEEFPALKVVKVETDPNPNLTEKFDVYGLPTLYVFKDGEPVDEKWEGIITKVRLLRVYLPAHWCFTCPSLLTPSSRRLQEVKPPHEAACNP